jgi:RNA polymerase sigma factor (sigma-70 family)
VAQPTRTDLERFVAEHYPRVVATVAMITGDRQGAPDAVQDALVGYLAKPPAAPIENLPAWITAVASNRLRDGHRRRGAESRAFAKIGVTPEAIEDASSLLDVDLQAALDKLPPRQRRICALHYLLDLSVDDVAAAMGVSTGTVKTQLFRARATLAAALRPAAEEVPA